MRRSANYRQVPPGAQTLSQEGGLLHFVSPTCLPYALPCICLKHVAHVHARAEPDDASCQPKPELRRMSKWPALAYICIQANCFPLTEVSQLISALTKKRVASTSCIPKSVEPATFPFCTDSSPSHRLRRRLVLGS